jgi:flagellar basal-body rod protein FlgB
MSEVLPIAIAAKALDGLSMRMTAIAQNLANANSPQFQPVKVDFEAALSRAAARGPDAVKSLAFEFVADKVYNLGDDRRLDLQIADASATAARYISLVDLIGRRMAIQHALTGGR